MKIISLTINPAIDKSTTVDALIPDNKLRCTTPVFEPGGGGINVSRALKNLKQPSLAVYLAGGRSGELMEKLLEKEGINQSLIKAENNTRENFIVVDSNNQQFRFGMPGAQINENEWKNCLSFIKDAPNDLEYVVGSGSIAPGIPDDFYGQLAQTCKDKGVKLILDCDGPALEEALKVGVFMIKPNLKELALLTGNEQIDKSKQEAMAMQLIDENKVEMVAVSMGPHGAMLATKDKITYASPPAVKCISTVGAGDSMVGGMVYALVNKMSSEDIIKYGVACGTASTINPGTELCKQEDVDRILKDIHTR